MLPLDPRFAQREKRLPCSHPLLGRATHSSKKHASGAQYYLALSDLATLVGSYSSDAAFGGVMMWSAGFSDSNVNNGCTYAQEAKRILTTGSAC